MNQKPDKQLDKQQIQKFLEVEQRIIHLMLKDRRAIDDLIQSGYSPELFDENHRRIVVAIYREFLNGGRLLTAEGYRQELIHSEYKASTPLLMEAFAKCDVKAFAEMDDLGYLKNNLIDAYVARKSNEGMQKYLAEIDKLGYFKSVSNLVDSLQQSLSLANLNKTSFTAIDEYKDEYLKALKELAENKEAIIRCDIPEIDNAMAVGFRPQHLTLFVADVGGHKCVKYDANIQLSDGTTISAEELFQIGIKPEMISLDDRSYKLYAQRPYRVFSNGIKECYRVTTRFGFSTEVTGNHPFKTLAGYTKLEDLVPGDFVAIAGKIPFGKVRVSQELATWIGGMLSDGGSSQSTYRFTNFDQEIVDKMAECTSLMGGKFYQITNNQEVVRGNYGISGMLKTGREFKIHGTLAVNKSIHQSIFAWDEYSTTKLLSMMYSCDGCITKEKLGRKIKVVYSSSSECLARNVRQLLLKYRLVAQVYKVKIKYNNEFRDSWQVVLQDIEQVKTFVSRIGFVGDKHRKAHLILQNCRAKGNRNIDTIPSEIWNILKDKFVDGKSHYGCRRFLKNGGDQGRGYEGHCGTKGKAINRSVLLKMSAYLGDEFIRNIATSDVLWDEIVSIEPIGPHETYDVTMRHSPNFVVDGFITHNTNMMLNVALRIWEKGHNVLFIPLEMNRQDLTNRIIANRTGIHYVKLATPEILNPDEWKRIGEADVWLKENHGIFSILDADERSTVGQIKREVEKRAFLFKPKVVVIDYVAIMKPDVYGKGQDRPDLMIGEILKSLRFLGKKHGFHIISAAQMGREAIKALRDNTDATPDSTSIRGSHEYAADADTIFALQKPAGGEINRLKIYTLKARHGKAGETSELAVDAACCRIHALNTATTLPTDLDTEMNKPTNEIESFVEQVQKTGSVQFVAGFDLGDDEPGGEPDDLLEMS